MKFSKIHRLIRNSQKNHPPKIKHQLFFFQINYSRAGSFPTSSFSATGKRKLLEESRGVSWAGRITSGKGIHSPLQGERGHLRRGRDSRKPRCSDFRPSAPGTTVLPRQESHKEGSFGCRHTRADSVLEREPGLRRYRKSSHLKLAQTCSILWCVRTYVSSFLSIDLKL